MVIRGWWWGFAVWKLGVCWRDVWAKKWCFEVVWGHRRILPRPKPQKLTVCSVDGEVKGTFIPASQPPSARSLIKPLSKKRDILEGVKPLSEEWPEIIE